MKKPSYAATHEGFIQKGEIRPKTLWLSFIWLITNEESTSG